jgi:hypothetical protein
MSRFAYTLFLSLMSLPTAAQTLYRSPETAQVHCHTGIVVWLNTNSGVYHFQGERWYGRTKHGAYVCEKDANAAGDRATENGQ